MLKNAWKIRFTEKSTNTVSVNNKCIISPPYVKELEGFTKYFFKKYSFKVVYSAKNKLNNIMKLGR